MFKEQLKYLVCPACKGDLRLDHADSYEERVKDGSLSCVQCLSVYPIIDFIARFVPAHNYADSFGFEWNQHKKTQYDTKSGVEASRKRFFEETRWGSQTENVQKGGVMLEAGCGSGRFTPHALELIKEGEGLLISFDYSNAIDASATSNTPSRRLLLIQASIFDLPIRDCSIDRCFCFGVLQHTPSTKDAIVSLVRALKPQGEFVCDHYPYNSNTPFNTKYWVRPITKRIPHPTLYQWGKKYIDFMWPVFKWNRKMFSAKRATRLNWRLLIPDYTHEGLSEEQLKEWAYLDFFDMLSPQYDRPIKREVLHEYLEQAGLVEVQTQSGYNGWEGRGIKA